MLSLDNGACDPQGKTGARQERPGPACGGGGGGKKEEREKGKGLPPSESGSLYGKIGMTDKKRSPEKRNGFDFFVKIFSYFSRRKNVACSSYVLLYQRRVVSKRRALCRIPPKLKFCTAQGQHRLIDDGRLILALGNYLQQRPAHENISTHSTRTRRTFAP